MSKRKETRWFEIHVTEREVLLLCIAAGTTVETFEQSDVPRVENFVRKAAIAAAKECIRVGNYREFKKW
jgi:hypothetical protein